MISRLNSLHKQIIKIFQNPDKYTKEKREEPGFSRQEVSRIFFSDPKLRKLVQSPFSVQKRTIPYQQNESNALFGNENIQKIKEAEKIKEREKYTTDWRSRVGIEPFSSRFYSKKQDVLNRGLKDLVKKGYLERYGPPEKGIYKPTNLILNPKGRKF